MVTKQQLTKAVKAHGGIVKFDRFDGCHDITIDAPRRKLWAASYTHSLVACTNERDEPLSVILQDAYERVADGLVDCTEVDCDSCTEVTQ